jgi:hypothetical protein
VSHSPRSQIYFKTASTENFCGNINEATQRAADVYRKHHAGKNAPELKPSK